jgi:predicted metal-dependent phosphoesterase TrpH
MHSGEDQLDYIRYTARELIERAVELKFDVLAFTFHGQAFEDHATVEFARERGILLIPGCEAYIGRKEVLCLNITQAEVDRIHTFDDLRGWKRAKGESGLIIAPHPFFPLQQCLKDQFAKQADLWDAVEYCHMHTRWLNFNRRAVREAKERGLPMVGTSDAHALFMLGRAYTWVEAEKDTLSVFRAIRAGKVERVSVPHTFWSALETVFHMEIRHKVAHWFSEHHRDRWLRRRQLRRRLREAEKVRRARGG